MKLTLSFRSAGSATGFPPSPYTVDRQAVRIGRAPECEIVLADQQNRISRLHCRIDWDGRAYVLTDSSTLGTLVNGSRISGPHRLAQGDILTIGEYQLGVTISATAGAARPGSDLDNWGGAQTPPAGPRPAQPGTAAMPAATALSSSAGAMASSDPVTQLLAAAGLPRNAVPLADAAILAASGALLRQLVTGLAATMAARARARKELGVGYQAADPGNPLLSDPVPQTVVADLLRAGPTAVQQSTAAFRLAEAHQRATLHAMQAALAKTLDALAPAAIRARTKGNDAALWKAYEAAFAGTADEKGFIDLFAKELGAAYEKLASSGPTG